MKKLLFNSFLILIFIFSAIPNTASAVNRFTFSLSDNAGTYAEINSDSGDYTAPFITTSSTLRFMIEPIEAIGSGQVLEKVSNSSSAWSGTQSITNAGGMWNISVSPGNYYFYALIGASPGGQANAIAKFTNVSVKPTMTASHSCAAPSQIALSWTAVPGPSTFYEIRRADLGSVVMNSYTNSYVDDGFNGAINPNTTYNYSITTFQNGSPVPNMTASATVTTGNCGGSATINVNYQNCLAPGLTWNIYGPSGTYTQASNTVPGNATYTIQPTVPSGYTQGATTNSKGGGNIMFVAAGENSPAPTFYIRCDNIPPPDGGWSAWSLGQCSTVACGVQPTRTDTRTCTNPTPANGGKQCTDPTNTNYDGQGATRTQNCGTIETCPPPQCTVGIYGPCSATACGQTGTQTASGSGGGSCPSSYTRSCSTPACPPVVDDPELPACTVDSFPNGWEYGGWAYPTWTTSNSNNVVLSGGQFGSGVSVEPDGQRSVNISSNTVYTITAYAGSSCSGTASRSATMFAEAEPACTVPGKEYLTSSDPNCKADPVCLIVDPYTGGDGFPDFSETGDGQTPIYWFSNAVTAALSGGPYSNYPVGGNSNGYFIFPNITNDTTVTLSGDNGKCVNSSILYKKDPPVKPTPFTAEAQACGTGQINLSWGESPGSYNYILYRNGTEIHNGPQWNPYGWNIKSDTGLTPGVTYGYSVIGESPNGNTEPNTVTAVAPAVCATVVTGTLTSASPSCTIASGASSCNINFSWTTTPSNAVPVSAVTSNKNNVGASVSNLIVANGNSGGPTAFVIPYPDRNFYLYNNSQQLASRSATSSCVSGTTWNGSSCVAVYVTPYVTPYPTPAPSATTLSANPTTIYPGESSTLTWTSGAGSCTGANFDTVGAANGNRSVTPVVTTTYVMNCDNSTTASATVTVKKKPGVIEN